MMFKRIVGRVIFLGSVLNIENYIVNCILCNDTARVLQCLCKGYAEVIWLSK